MFLSQGFKRAQSAMEYAVLLSVVMSALLLLQAIVKRGFSGNLREAADRMGEQYSPTSTTTMFERNMLNDQYINDEVNARETNAAGNIIGIDQFLPANFGYTPKYVGDMGIYSYTERLDQNYTTKSQERTDSASQEKFRWSEFPANAWPDFTDPFTIP